MNSVDSPRLLVAIASHGEKNLHFLKRIIHTYRSMKMQVDVVVVSDRPKDLGPETEVVIGAPTSNPWSLPFAHKRILAERLYRYDLFAYSEDDMLVNETNIRAFLRVTPFLAPDEIAGFFRYEADESGDLSFPDVHGEYHWKPESVHRRGEFTVAEFSNEHAAFYLLTRQQLHCAIASGGFLRGPYEGRYDMLCAAATDPYTSCGFRKVLCISLFEDFLIHHLSNRYAGRVGLPRSQFEDQLQTLLAIAHGHHPASNLCRVECDLSGREWAKSYYENPREEILALAPREARSILSVGCGWGATEERLLQRGCSVTALPLDSVIGATAQKRGIQVVYGGLDESLDRLAGQHFDCVLCTDLLHLLPNPGETLDRLSRLVEKNGAIVLSGPNFNPLRLLAKRVLGIGGSARLRELRDFHHGGVRTVGPAFVRTTLQKHGLETDDVRWLQRRDSDGIVTRLGRFGAPSWALRARRQTH